VKRLILTSALLIAGPTLHAQAGGVCSAINTINFCVTETNDGDNATSAGLNDDFGAALAFGDFDGDGFNDLAVGVPGENTNTGAVHIYRGSRSNVRTVPLVFNQSSILGQEGRFDERFGEALVAGDFNGDGIDDLAVGAPNENALPNGCGHAELAPCVDDGVVHVFSGRRGLGLQLPTGLTIDARDVFLSGFVIDHYLHFGQSLGAGDLDGDGIDELMIGAPDTQGNRFLDAGRGDFGQGVISILKGTANGLSFDFVDINNLRPPRGGSNLDENHFGRGPIAVATFAGEPQLVVGHPFHDDQGLHDVGVTWMFAFDPLAPINDQYALRLQLRQTSFGLAGQSDDDQFGTGMAAGDFNGDGFNDLAMGAPGRDIPKPGFGSIEDGGRIFIAYGTATGLNLANIQVLDQSFFPGQTVQKNDAFGASLAAGDISGDGIDDLLIGAPGEGDDDVGFVYFLVGSPQRLQVAASGSSIFSGGYIFSQGTIGSTNQTNDNFGRVLAVADVTGDNQVEIAIGVPERDHSSKTNAGQVYVTRRMQIGGQ
jgi:FG-GAP repeat